MVEEKYCYKCRKTLDISEFTKTGKICKKCRQIYHKEYTNTFNGFIKTLYKSAKRHSKRRINNGRELAGEFTIIEKDIFDQWDLQQGLCYYSKIPMIPKPLHNWQASLERKNPELGYIKSNIVLCVLELNTPITWSNEKIIKMYINRYGTN